MKPKPVAHIVIAGGSKPDLFECLLSLSESTYTNVETIVVDNSDGGLTEELSFAFPAVRVARPPRPLTFAQAVNHGFRLAIGRGAEAGFLLNDDVTVHPQTLTLLAEEEAKAGPGVYAPEIWPYEGAAARTRFAIDWEKRLVVSQRASSTGGAGEIDYAEGSAVFISKRVFEALGGFDEALGFYYEDADFSVRARDAGFPVAEVPGARAWHKGSVSAGRGLSPFKAYWRSRNALKFAMKHRKRANVAANTLYHFGEFVIPEAAKATARMLTGSRNDTRILAAIARGTMDLVTGSKKAGRFEVS